MESKPIPNSQSLSIATAHLPTRSYTVRVDLPGLQAAWAPVTISESKASNVEMVLWRKR